eukprot:4604726-Pyramimonas_sp.AAC.1
MPSEFRCDTVTNADARTLATMAMCASSAQVDRAVFMFRRNFYFGSRCVEKRTFRACWISNRTHNSRVGLDADVWRP